MYQIPYGKQEITDEDKAAVLQTLDHDFLTQGPRIAEFEAAFAEYVGATHAVAVANGTAALHLCALALGVGPDTHVITSPITFAASANCIRYCGGHIHFADIDPNTGLLDIHAVEDLLRSHPEGFFSGIIPVDFAGLSVDMQAFRVLADRYGLWIIEDACHAPGATFTDAQGHTQRAGSGVYADLAIFSFHPVKHIACGEGGMITTRKLELYQRLQLLRTHGITKDPQQMTHNDGTWYYQMQTLGYNYRLSDIQAALGISQLQRAQTNLSRRHAIAERYAEAFQEMPHIKPLTPFSTQHAYHLYVVLTEERKALYDHLRSEGIFAQVHYIPVHQMPYYVEQYGDQTGRFPNAERYYAQCLSLPMYPSLRREEQDYVLAVIKNL